MFIALKIIVIIIVFIIFIYFIKGVQIPDNVGVLFIPQSPFVIHNPFLMLELPIL